MNPACAIVAAAIVTPERPVPSIIARNSCVNGRRTCEWSYRTRDRSGTYGSRVVCEYITRKTGASFRELRRLSCRGWRFCSVPSLRASIASLRSRQRCPSLGFPTSGFGRCLRRQTFQGGDAIGVSTSIVAQAGGMADYTEKTTQEHLSKLFSRASDEAHLQAFIEAGASITLETALEFESSESLKSR